MVLEGTSLNSAIVLRITARFYQFPNSRSNIHFAAHKVQGGHLGRHSFDSRQRGRKCNDEGAGPLGEAVQREQSGVGHGLLCRCPALSAAHNRAVFRTPD